MTRALDNGPRHDREPHDWYVEPRWAVDALLGPRWSPITGLHHLQGWGTVWDPACGRGTILQACADWNIEARGTDLFDRGAGAAFFGEHDFLGSQANILKRSSRLSIVTNPPYSYKKGIAQAFVERALLLASEKVAVLVPSKWRHSECRFPLFSQRPPSIELVFCERPSMPPGPLIEQLGGAAFKRGKVDYSWLVWDLRNPASQMETRWIAPRPKAARV